MQQIQVMINQGVLLDFMGIGGGEFVVLVLVVLLLFGGKKLPELMRGLGKGIREFKDASEGVKREIHQNINVVTSDLEVDEISAKKERKQFGPAPDAVLQNTAHGDVPLKKEPEEKTE